MDKRFQELPEASLADTDVFAKALNYPPHTEEKVTWGEMRDALVAAATAAATTAIEEYIDDLDPLPQVPLRSAYNIAVLAITPAGSGDPGADYVTMLTAQGWQAKKYAGIAEFPPIGKLDAAISDTDTILAFSSVKDTSGVAIGWYCGIWLPRTRPDLPRPIEVVEITDIDHVLGLMTVVRGVGATAISADALLWFFETTIDYFDAILAFGGTYTGMDVPAALVLTLNQLTVPVVVGGSSAEQNTFSSDSFMAQLGLCDTSASLVVRASCNYLHQEVPHVILNGTADDAMLLRPRLPQMVRVSDLLA